MQYLLDMCVFSEYAKPKALTRVIDWVEDQSQNSLFLSVLTIGEIEKGIVRMPESKRKDNLAIFLEDLILRFDQHIISVDKDIMRRWGPIVGMLETKGRVLPVIDSLLAATALEHDLILVTRNEGDFVATGAKVLNIWH